MPDVTITIGGRSFRVACQPGEEPFLEAAAQLLDAEASALVGQLGRMPEAQMLLMAGLMVADKTAGLEERLRAAEADLAARIARIAALESAPPPPPAPDPEAVALLARVAERLEAMAATLPE
jgi:cell division protein ZapA